MAKQVRFISQPALVEGQDVAELAAFDAQGNPVDIAGGGDAPTTIPTGALIGGDGSPADPDAMLRGLNANMDKWVKAAGRETIIRAARRDPRKPRYARVPQGPTCGFCIMLVSRGFVYSSAEAAGGDMNDYHLDCDCEPVPSWDGRNPRIDGYDPDAMYTRYKTCRSTIEDLLTEERYRKTYVDTFLPKYEGDEPKSFDQWVARQIAAEMDWRDRQWLYDRTPCPIDYIKSREEIERNEPRDLFAIDNLSLNGFSLTTRAEDAPKGYSNIDLEINGLRWEIKSPDKGNKRSVESNLRKAKKQFAHAYPNPLSTVRVVFNGKYLDFDDDWIAGELRSRADQHGIDEVLQVRKDGTILRIK